MSDFLEKLNGKVISDNNSLHGRKRITVYVENESDVPFWKFIFAQQNVATQVTASTHYNETGNLHRGKQNVLRFADRTNKDFVLCIDSDFDYLLQNTTESSRKINENEFIFQTYVYAIEKYLI